jgi:hypothetical protein
MFGDALPAEQRIGTNMDDKTNADHAATEDQPARPPSNRGVAIIIAAVLGALGLLIATQNGTPQLA